MKKFILLFLALAFITGSAFTPAPERKTPPTHVKNALTYSELQHISNLINIAPDRFQWDDVRVTKRDGQRVISFREGGAFNIQCSDWTPVNPGDPNSSVRRYCCSEAGCWTEYSQCGYCPPD